MPANAPAPPTGGAHEKVEALHSLVLRSLDDDQAQDVVTIPLTGKSNIADHMVIASGRSTRQVASMAQKLTERIKKDLGRNVRIDGKTRLQQAPRLTEVGSRKPEDVQYRRQAQNPPGVTGLLEPGKRGA